MNTLFIPWLVDLSFYIGWAVLFCGGLLAGAWIIAKIAHGWEYFTKEAQNDPR